MLTIDEDCTATTRSQVAASLHTKHADFIAKDVEQNGIGWGDGLDVLSVDRC